MQRAILILAVLLIGSAAASAWAQPVPSRDPSSTHIFPAGARRGDRLAVRIGGECLPPGSSLIFSGSHVVHPPTLERRGPDRGEPSPRRKPTEIPILYPKEWESELTIAPDAPLGPVFWRLSCAQGGSSSRPFIIGDLPEFVETESNSRPESAQTLVLPVTVNGQISGERDVDYYRVPLQAGQWVVCETLCRRLGSRLDPTLEWIGPDGAAVAAEEIYLGSDRAVAVRATAAGEYLLRVANVSFEGSPAHVYRLNLTTTPLAIGATPSSLAVAQETDVQVLVFPAALQPTVKPRRVVATAGQTEVVVQSPEFRGTVTLPCDSRSRVRWPVTASETIVARDQPLVVEGQLTTESKSVSFALRIDNPGERLISGFCATTCDARIELDWLDEQGKLAQRAQPRDVGEGVTRLSLPATARGDYTIVVRASPLAASSPPVVPFRISIEQPSAALILVASHDMVNVRQGATMELEVTARREGDAVGPIQISAESLPAGLTLEQAVIPANAKSAKVRFKATDDVPSAPYVLRLTGRTEVDGREVVAPVMFRHLGRDDEGASVGPSTLGELHVTVQHKPVFRLQCAEAYQYAHRGSVYPYWMEIERLDGFDGPITFQLGDRQNRDLDGIEMLETTVGAGETRFAMPIYLPETMHINVQSQSQLYTQGYARFIDRHGRSQSVLVVSEKRNMLRTLPPVVRLDASQTRCEWRSPTEARCRLKLERTSNFPGPMRLELVAGPAGVKLRGGAVDILEGATDVEVVLECDASGLRDGCTLRFRASGAMAGGAQAVTEASVPLPVVNR